METRKILLTEDEMPRKWYNILADIKMNPPLGPDGNPITPDALAPVFPMNLIEQEVSTERWIDIPEPVLDISDHLAALAAGPRRCAWKRLLGTPARIYYKNEGVQPAGKPQTQYGRSPGLLQQDLRHQAA